MASVSTSPLQRLSDPLVRLRDGVLARVLGSGECVTAPAASAAEDASLLAAELKQAMSRLKAQAISEDGNHVNYAALRESDAFAAYRRLFLPRLAALDPSAIAAREERIAFWINLYNALIIDAVISFGVQRSVTEGRLGLLTFFRRAAYNIGGHCTSCDDIEHGILRANRGNLFMPGPQFAGDDPRRAWVIDPIDPRIHFALNCASRSCPPINVYDASRLDEQLTLAARSFIDETTALHEDRLVLSPILRWYAGDFGGRAGVLNFVRDHLPDNPRHAWLQSQGPFPKITYSHYDWQLNVKQEI
jgi:hypothetical protein